MRSTFLLTNFGWLPNFVGNFLDVDCFVETYFDIIIQKLKGILKSFKLKLEEIENVIQNAPFENVVKIVTDSFEHIFKTSYLYNPEILKNIYNQKDYY